MNLTLFHDGTNYELILITPVDVRLQGFAAATIPSSGMWRRVALVRTDVSEECVASIIRVKRIMVLETALA
jgi:hypothetical protein